MGRDDGGGSDAVLKLAVERAGIGGAAGKGARGWVATHGLVIGGIDLGLGSGVMDFAAAW